MGNGSGRKKNKDEVSAYKRSIRSNSAFLESTVGIRNSNLTGSAEAYNEMSLEDSQQEIQIPFRIRAKRFLKNHIFESILSLIVSLIVILAGWYAKTLIDLKIEYAVFENRLTSIEDQIDDLSIDNVTREILTLQVDALRQELLSDSALQKSEIDNRIDLLEQQIDILQESALSAP